jgi:hypothetical protein
MGRCCPAGGRRPRRVGAQASVLRGRTCGDDAELDMTRGFRRSTRYRWTGGSIGRPRWTGGRTPFRGSTGRPKAGRALSSRRRRSSRQALHERPRRFLQQGYERASVKGEGSVPDALGRSQAYPGATSSGPVLPRGPGNRLCGPRRPTELRQGLVRPSKSPRTAWQRPGA